MKIIIYCEANSERQYYKAICDQLGAQAIVADNTSQFKDFLKKDDFQLILLTLHLVNCHSFELTKYIRNQRKYTNTPVIVMTANERSEVLPEALNAQISDVCEKRQIGNLTSIIKRMQARFKQINANILYLEDDKAIAAVTIETLKIAGISIDWCSDIKTAQNYALNKTYDMVLLDTVLNNNESGIDFLIWLRSNASESNQSIPVLVISSFNAADRKIQIFNAGADDFLSKPYVEDELLARIVSLIERKIESVKGTNDSKMEQKRNRFLATITHDMRSPLNAVLGNLQLLETSELNDIQSNNVNHAIESAKLLNDLIQDILEFSIIEDNQFSLYPKLTNLNELCQEVFNTIDVSLDSNNVRLNMYVDPQLPEIVSVDPLRLKQLLLNILSNAAKFTAHGHIDFNVTFNDENKEAIFHVVDTGKGIDEHDQSLIFDTFSQTDKDSKEAKEGFGLGLSICSKLVALFGGELKVESQLNKGSDFYFNLPLIIKEKTVTEPKKVIAFEDNNYEVLIVDDNKFNLEVMRSFLGKINIKCQCATNGQQGLKLLEKHKFNAVILDCQMPIMDGYTMAQEMRYDSDFNCISIIASSGTSDEKERQKCIESGMDLFLPKPVVFNDVKSVLEKAFERTSLCDVSR